MVLCWHSGLLPHIPARSPSGVSVDDLPSFGLLIAGKRIEDRHDTQSQNGIRENVNLCKQM